MPRQDVPYGGAICRLKERIAEIWDKLDEKLHSINGVEGDGAGNVEIVSGDAAVVINNDQIGHRIEVSLDSSKLPSAAVSSVNGQTGAVRLDAADIPSDGNSNVQADVDANKTAINALSGDIASEQTARQNADAALQTNINATKASIPEMSTRPDPCKGVERDVQGRAFAADPESGATDKTLVTANWVSQTGDGAPNNLIHKNGNETKNGVFSVDYPITGTANIKIVEYSSSLRKGRYRLIFKILRSSVLTYFRDTIVFIETGREDSNKGLTYIIISIHAGNASNLNVFNIGRTSSDNIRYVLSFDDDYIYLWRSNLSNEGINANSFMVFEDLNTAINKSYPNIKGGTTADDSDNYIGTLIAEKSI